MRVCIDAMGGDHAPEEIVKGTVEAISVLPDDELMLVGPGEKLNEMVRDLGGPYDRLKIIPATEVVAMSESPVVAIRKKPDSSLR
ncbi:MAG: phosphate--acyl-ACP acyltransferase, partial [Phycisphaerae bacterium]|nr:phosphate--acyl-ACP acyltransferase [Phycisphaerae bacterium]